MDCDTSSDYDLLRIKENLNRNKIKLWLTPYFTEKEGVNEKEMKDLAQTCSSQLSIPSEACLECLYRLQTKALDNVRQQNNFRNTGVATLNVKVHGRHGVERILPLGVKLSITGFSLKKMISKESLVSVEMLKVIFNGKVLKDEETLESQGLKNGHHLMAVILRFDLNLSRHERNIKLLDSVKEDVKLLTGDKTEEDYLQVADQSGKLLKLPDNERRALILAMTLHEKGRAAIKEEDFPTALFLLLEAEKEFSYCNSNLLKSVDNYGLLNLDIVWCYLNMKSVSQLPDAEQRLYQCELSFHQSYGPSLERLIMLKGSAGNENALFMRLHLLQAIVFYHQNKFSRARELLDKVEQELKCLEVDDFQLSHLVELGYGAAEARLALRQSSGDLNAAVNIIENKRLERKKNEEAEKKEKELLREKKKLGKCMNGEWIEPQFHKALMSMGYSFEIAKWALAQTCNSICNAVNVIQEHPDFLPGNSQDITDDSIAKVSSLGFEPQSAKKALQKHKGNVDKAIEELVSGGAALDISESSDSSSDSDDSSPSTSERKQKEAYSRVSEGISTCAEDHLDLSLTAEKAFLQKYRDFLSK